MREVTITAQGRRIRITGTKSEYLDGLQGWNADTAPVAQATKDLARGALCLDVGANIGATCLTLAVQRPDVRIIAFEPVPENADCLRRNIQTNSITNIDVVQAAASDRRGVLHITNNGPWSTVTPGAPIQCRAIPLDDYAESDVAFVKIDTEGHEPFVCAGARSLFIRHQPIVLMEFNSWCLLVRGYNPIEFSKAIWESSHVIGLFHLDKLLPPPKEAIGIAYENIAHHQGVTDVLLRPCLKLPELDAMIYSPEIVAIRKGCAKFRNEARRRWWFTRKEH
ncbi:MAG: FkbM family methyltransferase [Reyranella sp.]|nr:FkbM family methyltransferase [Reyranella sp.]